MTQRDPRSGSTQAEWVGTECIALVRGVSQKSKGDPGTLGHWALHGDADHEVGLPTSSRAVKTHLACPPRSCGPTPLPVPLLWGKPPLSNNSWAPHKVASVVQGGGGNGGNTAREGLQKQHWKSPNQSPLQNFQINLPLKTASGTLSFNSGVSPVYGLVVKS